MVAGPQQGVKLPVVAGVKEGTAASGSTDCPPGAGQETAGRANECETDKSARKGAVILILPVVVGIKAFLANEAASLTDFWFFPLFSCSMHLSTKGYRLDFIKSRRNNTPDSFILMDIFGAIVNFQRQQVIKWSYAFYCKEGTLADMATYVCMCQSTYT